MKPSKGIFTKFQNSASLAPLVLLVSGMLIQVLWYVQLWTSLIEDAALKGMDFVSFYSAGIVARTYGLVNAYDVALQQSVQSQIVGPGFVPDDTLMFNHPPYLLPVLMKITSGDYPLSYILWSAVLLLLVGLGMVFVVRTLTAQGFSPKYASLMGLVGVMYYPVFMGILKGQDSALMLLGTAIWMYALTARKDVLAGMGLSLATIKPQVALVMAIPFLFNRRRVWWGFCLGTLVLFGYSVLLVGFEGVRDLFDILLVSAGGEGFGLNQKQMFNLLGLLLRTFPTIDPDLARGIGWGAFILSILGLCCLWKKAGSDLPYPYLGLAVVVGLFVSPHLHFHDLSLLLVAVVFMALVLYRGERLTQIWAVSLVLLTSLVLLFAGVLPPPWLYWASYLLLFALALGFVVIKKYPIKIGVA
jgi:hypothetical protein